MDLYDILFAMKHGHCGDYYTDLFAANNAGEWKTVSGPIVHIEDAKAAKVKSLKAQIEPVQDLHGQDAPYPAGGGKNKLPNTYTTTTINGVTFTVYDDGSINVNGTTTGRVDYYLSGSASGGSLSLPEGSYILTYGDATLSTTGLYMQFSKSGTTTTVYNSASFEASELGWIRLIITTNGAVINNVKIYPMIRLASVTDATFAPYSNICPISGHTGVNVQKTGVNVLNLSEWECESNSGITIGTDNISIFNKAYQETLNRYNVLNRLACVFSFHVKTVSLSDSRASFAVYADGTAKLPGSGTTNVGNITLDSVGTEKDISLTVPNGTEYISFGGWAWSGTVEITNIQLELGSTATPYEPYKSHTYPISWQTEAGTVYGGTVDVVAGELVVTMVANTRKLSEFGVISTATNCTRYRYTGNFFGADAGLVKNNHSAICNVVPYDYSGADTPHFYPPNDTNNRVELYVPIGTSTDTDVQICAELAQPQTYQLTAEEVATFLGTNNIWADTGDTEVTYRAKKS